MKNRSFVFPTIVLLWLVFIFASPAQQKAMWKGTIEKIDGITVVKNPKEPMYGEGVFLIKEELSIGEEGKGEEYFFADARDIAVDEEGKFYILDIHEAHIKIFDKNGKYIKTIGKKGQGPGEMSFPSSIQITPADEIAVNDSAARKIHFFDLEGNFLHAVSQLNMSFFTDPKIDRRGNISASYMIVDKEVTYVLKTFDRQLQESIAIFSVVVLKYPKINPFYPRCFWDLIKEDKIIWGFAEKYELFIIDSEGKTAKKITKEFDPVKITEEEKESLIQERFGGRENMGSQVKLIWDDFHNPFIFLCVDDNGRIFTRTYEKEAESGEYYYDVFDPDGKYLAKIPLKSRPYVIKKGKLYTIEKDNEGYQLVKRYGITWKI
jgi:hypothetical protein